VIGIGVKYLFIFWPIAAMVLFLAAQWRRKRPDNPLMRSWNYIASTLSSSPSDNPVPSSWVFNFGGQAPPASNEDKADGSSWWLGSILLAVILALTYLLILGGLNRIHEHIDEPKIKTDSVLSVPYVGLIDMYIHSVSCIDYVSRIHERYDETKALKDREVLSYLPYINMTVTGSTEPAVEGILLSHDTDYWYVFAEKGTENGETLRSILVIPADKASEICVVRENTKQERDCTY
jgi:hypothetical protein